MTKSYPTAMGVGGVKYCDFELPELIKIISNRIQKLEPENALKILGCLFLREPTDQEMILLAFCTDDILYSKVRSAKNMLNALAVTTNSSPPIQIPVDLPGQINSFSSAGTRPLLSPNTVNVPHSYWDPTLVSDQQASVQNLDLILPAYPDSVADEYPSHNRVQFYNVDDQLDPATALSPNFSANYCYQASAVIGGFRTRNTHRSHSLTDFPFKACHYYYKGYCKHGSSCRYFHGASSPDGHSQILSPKTNDVANEEHNFSPTSLEKLEMEIKDLLRSKNGPVSIAALPMMYFEKYGRNLQADGYLTESQRHGRAGFSLTKLLARLRNSIRLLDRPHGQHCVVLAEDASKYMGFRNERSDCNAADGSSHQIYLTFPAESTFSEDDVANYFRQYGPVDDVRIPCQEKRMFGFVSFVYPETVSDILAMRNPHSICDACVLVKPYKEKTRNIDRTYIDKARSPTYSPKHFEIDPELHATPRGSRCLRFSRKQLLEEHRKLLKLEQRHLSEFTLNQRPVNQQPHFDSPHFDVENSELPVLTRDMDDIVDHFSYALNALHISANTERTCHTANDATNQESAHIELPDSPFSIDKQSFSSRAV